MTPAPTTAPHPAAAPVAGSERIGIVDVVRGVAVLGILLMTIPFFYGLVGMHAFLLRRVAPRWLAMGVPLVAIFAFVADAMSYQNVRDRQPFLRRPVPSVAPLRGPAAG
jgi:uncharacterized membrane protein YeiB